MCGGGTGSGQSRNQGGLLGSMNWNNSQPMSGYNPYPSGNTQQLQTIGRGSYNGRGQQAPAPYTGKFFDQDPSVYTGQNIPGQNAWDSNMYRNGQYGVFRKFDDQGNWLGAPWWQLQQYQKQQQQPPAPTPTQTPTPPPQYWGDLEQQWAKFSSRPQDWAPGTDMNAAKAAFMQANGFNSPTALMQAPYYDASGINYGTGT